MILTMYTSDKATHEVKCKCTMYNANAHTKKQQQTPGQ